MMNDRFCYFHKITQVKVSYFLNLCDIYFVKIYIAFKMSCNFFDTAIWKSEDDQNILGQT